MGKRGQAPRKFTPEFKAAAVQRARDEVARGGTQSSIARALGLNASVLGTWMQAAAAGTEVPRAESLEEENRRLRREVETLRLERDFAKKAAAYFAREIP
jgi:transposase